MRKVIGSSPISSTKPIRKDGLFLLSSGKPLAVGQVTDPSPISSTKPIRKDGLFFCHAVNRLQWVRSQIQVPYRPPSPSERMGFFFLPAVQIEFCRAVSILHRRAGSRPRRPSGRNCLAGSPLQTIDNNCHCEPRRGVAISWYNAGNAVQYSGLYREIATSPLWGLLAMTW